MLQLWPGDNICNSQQETEKMFYNVITTDPVRNIINGKVFPIFMCKWLTASFDAMMDWDRAVKTEWRY